MKRTVISKEEHTTYEEALLAIIRSGQSKQELSDMLGEYHDNDIASILPKLTESEQRLLLDAVGHEAMAAILAYLDGGAKFLLSFSLKDISLILSQMDSDDTLFLLDGADGNTREELLKFISDIEVKNDIELIESYGDDEFGSRMSTSFIELKRDSTVKEAMRTLVREAPENDNIYTLFVTDRDGSFFGAISLKDLISARSDDVFESLISEKFPFVYDRESISENISHLRGYSEDLIPVLSTEGKKLLGVISSHDIANILDDEFGDDYAKLAALGSEEEENESLSKSIKKRIPWLTALLFLGLIVSAVVGAFEKVVSELPMIVAFQSLILGMAGNVGTQSLAVTVRILGDRKAQNLKGQLSLIIKETRIAFLNGMLIAMISFITVAVYMLTLGGYTTEFVLPIAGCAGGAMWFSMMISGMTGTAIPITLYRMGIDPAVASGPLITTINDLAAVISYYGLAFILLLKIV